MTNVVALEMAIVKAKETKKNIAKKLGITEMTLFRKINNITEFKASEIVALKKMLGLSAEERDNIFFANCGDYKSTKKGA